ncbi:MAG: cofactor-independent phosphoglycerate mutase [Syntrophobacteraceae bacterium]|nr:cofactor-independent phosphoglycerate mutase [Syntrophobacteraceae bacterium]
MSSDGHGHRAKFVILVGDGMGDYPLAELGGRTPLEVATTPHMDRLALYGEMGTVLTIPPGMEPGSDVANLSLLGYDPASYHTGRAPLEAASMGIRMGPSDVAYRCNLVTLEQGDGGVTRMGDYSAGHISTPEAHQLVSALQQAVAGTQLKLYPGVSYRHLLLWPGGREDLKTTPPHDITGEPAEPHYEVYRSEPLLLGFMERAAAILADHPVNRARREAGRREANSVWLWGQGRAPSMPTLAVRAGLHGAMISAVDLLKGMGVYAGLDAIAVPGATGYLDTNYAGKVQAALKALEEGDFVYLHIEAPDEAGHEGSLEKKIQAIEAFDRHVVGPMVEGLKRFSKVNLLVVTDHLTPVHVRTHVSDPVPFLLVVDLHSAHAEPGRGKSGYSESNAAESGLRLADGVSLFNRLIELQ